MLKFSNTDLHQNTEQIQNLATKHPVLIDDGDKKQVLLDYSHYKKIVGEDADKPFLSAYDVAVANMPADLAKALAELDDDELE